MKRSAKKLRHQQQGPPEWQRNLRGLCGIGGACLIAILVVAICSGGIARDVVFGWCKDYLYYEFIFEAMFWGGCLLISVMATLIGVWITCKGMYSTYITSEPHISYRYQTKIGNRYYLELDEETKSTKFRSKLSISTSQKEELEVLKQQRESAVVYYMPHTKLVLQVGALDKERSEMHPSR